jgi:ribonuclease HI
MRGQTNIPKRLLIYSDGGARGNPGPAAAAFLATDETGTILHSSARFIGVRTNNQAEYEALISALEYALSVQAEEVVCRLDSELVARQMKGEYSVKNPELRLLYVKAHALRVRFKSANFFSVRRENPFIQKADALVNKTLDEQATKF